jgi:putative membrane protein
VSQLIVFLALAFSIVIAIFAVSNTAPVEVSFLTFRSAPVAASVLVLISVALGAATMVVLGVAREVSLRWSHRGTTQQLKAAQARIAQLEAAQPAAALPPTAAASVPINSGVDQEKVPRSEPPSPPALSPR